MSSGLSAFDKYNIHARLYPGLLTALPVTVLVFPLVAFTTAATLVPLLASSGVLLLVAHQVRSLGVKTEARLTVKWDGMPTTRRLRLRSTLNAMLLARRRRKLEEMYGEPLPDADMEQLEPVVADEIYIAATRYLITKVRQRQDEFPLVQEEVTSYGFRRNFRGAKWFAVSLTIACLVVDGLLVHFTGMATQNVTIAAFHIMYLLAILLIVQDSWVQEAGERYADRLFEALDGMDDLQSQQDVT